MSAAIAWGASALAASTVLMLVVLVVRAPARRLVGPRLAYLLWLLPALRMVLPPLPAGMLPGLSAADAAPMAVLFTGPRNGGSGGADTGMPMAVEAVLLVWLAGAIALFAIHAVRHARYCRRLQASATIYGRSGGIRILAAAVEGPLAFGVVRRFIAVPRRFAEAFTPGERDLAIAHEAAHHARGDLLANWLSLIVLAAHWWNPVAWVAIRAFRDDQEFATDAMVLAQSTPEGRRRDARAYAHVLAKAAGIGALPACNLNPRSNLKGRLMMLAMIPPSNRRLAFGSAALVLAGGAALAATAATPASTKAGGGQAVTLGVKPDGAGRYSLIVGGSAVAPGAPSPGGLTLPADFTAPAGCDLTPAAKPFAMVIKGSENGSGNASGGTRTYTVMCGSAAPAPIDATLAEGLASLSTMRASVASQPATPVFPESERSHALGAIDRSIRDVKATLATIRSGA
ncbi:M56 family metallopeptidase [Polymorphobacter fuscus]|uniref:Peptidase M56 domain-containing protein n=1 Tax=Sandarakinorhabdus fusca TaxID=1439888 RepID=A0A7C9KL18_9SPHN|nr:M56 family metallopeptidase [Polymorphobacter fuscus]KAB7647593.1 hypothetical protein F9290_06290 [Polymorphobacter fuscus]MQT16863.1 hypothetical protein [Polymorphobacter fuscus]NJC09148.1 beta-lactamase regulating signal transducer with metallopeptidase domain [Polymorphobacter fuscus]